MRALISVSDKTGVVELAKELEALGIELISTGGTYKKLAEAGVKAMEISELTGFRWQSKDIAPSCTCWIIGNAFKPRAYEAA